MQRRRLGIAVGVLLVLVAAYFGYLVAAVLIPRENSRSPGDPQPVTLVKTITLSQPTTP
jgi:hypothetical protein